MRAWIGAGWRAVRGGRARCPRGVRALHARGACVLAALLRAVVGAPSSSAMPC